MDTLYLVMPAYNEAENIEQVVRSWDAVLKETGENSKLVIADSGSTDATHEILLKLQEQKCPPHLIILPTDRKEHGPKLIALYDYAVKNGADYIFQTDSDGQTNPDEFQQFWKYRRKYDAVIGKRPARGDGKSRKFIEDVLCVILKCYFKVTISDANAPFRLMKAELVEKYLKKLPKDYGLPNVMLTTYFVYFKENIKFRNITFQPRQGGVNSINMKRIIRIGWKSLHDFHLLKKELED